jgi:putative colanic acid biosynthesis glycosyltransferase
MKVLQINTTSNPGSTGRIAEEIGKTILRNGDGSYIAYSRSGMPSSFLAVPNGNQRDVYLHVLQTRLFDTHGFGSKKEIGNVDVHKIIKT